MISLPLNRKWPDIKLYYERGHGHLSPVGNELLAGFLLEKIIKDEAVDGILVLEEFNKTIEKSKEIGIRRTMGALKTHIIKIYFLESFMVFDQSARIWVQYFKF